jgi:uncharacterized surface protein with fasciclin (FAS1) repeats
MKNSIVISIVVLISALFSCQNATNTGNGVNEESAEASSVSGQSAVTDDQSAPNVVKVAISSTDHSTLVKAVTAAELVDVLSNNGPFTVFAPTNEAFSQLPAGTLEELLKPEKKTDLQNILQYHVWVGVLTDNLMSDGLVLNMVDGNNATLTMKDGKYMVNDANIVASVRASNGIVHVIDKVIMPK